MIELPIYNRTGQEVAKLSVDEALLGGQVRPALLKQALVMYQANKRQGTVATKGRGEVEGSTKKLYAQRNCPFSNWRMNDEFSCAFFQFHTVG